MSNNKNEKQQLITIIKSSQEKGFNNIALFGNYGYGKTCLVKDLFNSDEEEKRKSDYLLSSDYQLITIQLNDFLNIKERDETIQFPIYISEGIINNLEKSDKKNRNFKNVDNKKCSEKKYIHNIIKMLNNCMDILKCYLIHLFSLKINFSLYSENSKTRSKMFFSSFFLIILLILLNVCLFYPNPQFNPTQYINYWLNSHDTISFILPFIFLYCLSICIYKVLIRKKIHKFRLNSLNFEFKDKFPKKTITNRYSDLIVFLFDTYYKQKNVIISFEDIDRLKNTDFLEYLDFLKYYNYVLNSINSDKNFIFIYSLNDFKISYGLKNKYFDKSIDINTVRNSKKLEIILLKDNNKKYNTYYMENQLIDTEYINMLNSEYVKKFLNGIDSDYSLNFLNDYREINSFIENIYCQLHLILKENTKDDKNSVYNEIFFAVVLKSIVTRPKEVIMKLDEITKDYNYFFVEHFNTNLAYTLSKEFDIYDKKLFEFYLSYLMFKIDNSNNVAKSDFIFENKIFRDVIGVHKSKKKEN